mmetsp:Transcript_22839/g.53833  ORF Transcript_22839/g.53833 Transcript_22839/m.53833 type:complete len:1024 (+) Transcript_22839:83-3154(+)
MSSRPAVEARVDLPDDPEEARVKYIKLRQLVRETFESFLRSLNSQSLRWLEQQFEDHGEKLNSGEFLRIFSRVCPRLDSAAFPKYEERKLAVHLSVLKLFEGMDVDESGETSWMEFVEFISAVAEELRLKAQELSGQIFEFHTASLVLPNYKPTITKCHFDKVYFWPNHPMESAIVFEEGQASFFLHRQQTMLRRRRVDGHQSDLLAAAFLYTDREDANVNLIVTSGNDKTLCFWDANAFNLVKRWSLKDVVGELCWCGEINALYAADHFSERFWGWLIRDELEVKTTGTGGMKPDKSLEFKNGHSKAIQAMKWLEPLQCLATASLDTTVQIFDTVQQTRAHVLQGHTKGITCLEFCEKSQMLLSAGFDSYIAIWDPSAGTLSFKLTGHECSVTGLCKMPETDYEFMSVDFDGVVRLWDVRRLCCIQSFHATDRRAEEAGELERLEPRALCPLSRDRVVISGRRIVVFDRDAGDPKMTSDWPINALAFDHRNLEIVTPIKNDLYVWDALTGQRLQIHDNVIDANITAICFGAQERRIFVGDDQGSINCINAACGAQLKSLTPHAYEVAQIECMPGKVLTLSAPEKVINVHDDTDEKKAILLKRIDVSGAGVILRFAHDEREMLVISTEEGEVGWYSADFAKQIADTSQCAVNHSQAVSCCYYFKNAPLIVSADAGSAIFWSVPPLRPYDFFSKILLDVTGDEEATVAITSMSLSWPDEGRLFVGTDRGAIASIDISMVVESAKQQQTEILRRKESGEAAEVISGRIFDSLPRPVNSPAYVFGLDNLWLVQKAHAMNVEQIFFCRRQPPVLLTLGGEASVRLWDHATGQALGTLEQGLPEGLVYQRSTDWTFPLDPHRQIQSDIDTLAEAAELNAETANEPTRRPSRTLGADSSMYLKGQTGERILKLVQKRRIDGSLNRSTSTPDMVQSSAGGKLNLLGPGKVRGQDYTSVSAKYLQPLQRNRMTQQKAEDWYAGSAAGSVSLPKLQSGMARPTLSETKQVLDAARKLAIALGSSRNSKDARS